MYQCTCLQYDSKETLTSRINPTRFHDGILTINATSFTKEWLHLICYSLLLICRHRHANAFTVLAGRNSNYSLVTVSNWSLPKDESVSAHDTLWRSLDMRQLPAQKSLRNHLGEWQHVFNGYMDNLEYAVDYVLCFIMWLQMFSNESVLVLAWNTWWN